MSVYQGIENGYSLSETDVFDRWTFVHDCRMGRQGAWNLKWYRRFSTKRRETIMF